MPYSSPQSPEGRGQARALYSYSVSRSKRQHRRIMHGCKGVFNTLVFVLLPQGLCLTSCSVGMWRGHSLGYWASWAGWPEHSCSSRRSRIRPWKARILSSFSVLSDPAGAGPAPAPTSAERSPRAHSFQAISTGKLLKDLLVSPHRDRTLRSVVLPIYAMFTSHVLC